MDEDKERLLAGVRTWLEGIDTDKLRTAAPEREESDLFSLHVALGALKTEVKHEARHFKGALDQFRALFDELQHANVQLQTELNEQRQMESEQTREAERGLLLELLELRDRLTDGQSHAAGYRPRWLARKGGADDFVARIADGMSMNLQRLDEILIRRDVRPIEAVGQPFDPLVMNAVDIVEDSSLPANQVVSEIRTGYMRGDVVLRTAAVIANKLPNQ